DGAGASVGRPSRATLITAGAMSVVLTLLGLPLGLPPLGGCLMLVLSASAVLAVTALARRAIGGQTGDVVGAAQQGAEIAALLGLVAAIPA
ncbi:adenosylcobinamide-GDP ribazoletransferase, partial [Methylobacterium goesingense]|uniref:adenosylcobinamide-GDP ribazoletransferase n=1 Tax=Methylobacterium goesingense TaxID=243690 RepID=UPI00363DA5AD